MLTVFGSCRLVSRPSASVCAYAGMSLHKRSQGKSKPTLSPAPIDKLLQKQGPIDNFPVANSGPKIKTTVFCWELSRNALWVVAHDHTASP